MVVYSVAVGLDNGTMLEDCESSDNEEILVLTQCMKNEDYASCSSENSPIDIALISPNISGLRSFNKIDD